jgi:hypothetical protein
MTVAELIEKLQALPPDKEVWIRDGGMREVAPLEESIDGMFWPWFAARRIAWDAGDETEFHVVTL